MPFVDSHCHLDDDQFAADRETVIQRAYSAGLKYMLAIGTGNGPPDLDCALQIADRYPFVYATVGVHPNDAPKLSSDQIKLNTFENLRQLLRHPKCKAVGEIGLDYYRGVSKDVQMPVFIRQLELASDAHLPVVIHSRDAWPDTLAVLREHWAPTKLPCILHCFTGNAALAGECLSLGFHLAFGGATTYPKSHEIREAARITPADRLLLETDAPYLPPVPHRGKRNEPSFITHTAQLIADLRGVPVDELGAQTTANFETLFQLAAPAVSDKVLQLH